MFSGSCPNCPKIKINTRVSITFFTRSDEKKDYTSKMLEHSYTFKKSFKKSQKLLTVYKSTQNLKKPDLGLWSFGG